ICVAMLTSLLFFPSARCQAVQAENVTVLEGGTAQISCRLQNYDGSIVVIQNPRRQTLFFNGTRRALKDDRFQMVLFTPRLVRITLTNVSVTDEGGYFCQLYTAATHHQVATLSVLVPPEMPTVEVKQEAVEGDEVELTCVSPRSKPATSLRWVRNSREIPGAVSQQDNGKTFSVSNTIRIPVERKDNGAALSCEASHQALGGQKKIRHYRLDVYFAPSVRIVPPSGILREGDSLSLTCSVTGNPLHPVSVLFCDLFDLLGGHRKMCSPQTFLCIPELNKSDNGFFHASKSTCQSSLHTSYCLWFLFPLTTMVPSTTQPITSHPTTPTLLTRNFALDPKDPGAVVETHSAVPYAVIGGILALLVFTVICVLIVTIWCSVRQKGSYLTHEASGLDEHGEVQEAFLNGNDTSQGKKEYLL
uniref:Cell adhesion molecule 4 n=2 Tax=Tetraodon nigroviridis TaxID=99883 RepID=H3CGZ0_TETNG